MKTRERIWTGAAIAASTMVLGACLSGGGSGGGGRAAALAEALSDGVDFTDGTAIDGDIPDATAPDVIVSPDSTVIIAPGETNILSLGVDNPMEADDPIGASLVQFEAAKRHTRVPGAARGGLLELEFSVADDICDDLCNETHDIDLHVAAVTDGDEVGPAATQAITLDCSETGRSSACAGAVISGGDPELDAACENLATACPGLIGDPNMECGGLYSCIIDFYAGDAVCEQAATELTDCSRSSGSVDCVECTNHLEYLMSTCPEPRPCLEASGLASGEDVTVAPEPGGIDGVTACETVQQASWDGLTACGLGDTLPAASSAEVCGLFCSADGVTIAADQYAACLEEIASADCATLDMWATDPNTSSGSACGFMMTDLGCDYGDAGGSAMMGTP